VKVHRWNVVALSVMLCLRLTLGKRFAIRIHKCLIDENFATTVRSVDVRRTQAADPLHRGRELRAFTPVMEGRGGRAPSFRLLTTEQASRPEGRESDPDGKPIAHEQRSARPGQWMIEPSHHHCPSNPLPTATSRCIPSSPKPAEGEQPLVHRQNLEDEWGHRRSFAWRPVIFLDSGHCRWSLNRHDYSIGLRRR
jgi:hypothetical protein